VETDERAHRAKTQKIFLANRNVDDNSATFQVLGSTGNIYNVALDGAPICSCPDHSTRGSRCKHILFMLIKIFNVEDPYKTTFTQEEIQKYIDAYKANISRFNVQVDPNTVNKSNVNYDVGEKYLDDDCCVCLDPIQNGEERVHCKKVCGRCIHTNCYNMIKQVSKNCPYCMQKMVV
jgi:hypothetical protein